MVTFWLKEGLSLIHNTLIDSLEYMNQVIDVIHTVDINTSWAE